jgi:hypothetical protein
MRKNIFKRDYIKVLCLFKNNNVCFGDLVENPFTKFQICRMKGKTEKTK